MKRQKQAHGTARRTHLKATAQNKSRRTCAIIWMRSICPSAHWYVRPKRPLCFLLYKYILQSLELHGEVAHERCFPRNSYTACNLSPALINVLQRSCYNSDVVVCVDAARNGKAQQVETCEAVFASNRVAVGQEITNLASADTSRDKALW